MSYYNLCGIGSQHSNISKGKLEAQVSLYRSPDINKSS